MDKFELNGLELILAGGPVMYFILLCSLFALAIFIEKMIYFSSINTNVQRLKNRIFSSIKDNKFKEAVTLCDNNQAPIAKILKAGITKNGSSREEIKEAMEDASLFEAPKLEKRLSALATIAHIAPLLGLLGTVMGMTRSFHTIQIRSTSLNPVSPGDLAGGIWEALLTTVAGLIVAIPTYVAYNYCVSRVNRIILEIEHGATELLHLLHHISETQTPQKGE